MGPTWVQSASGGPHVGLVNLAIWDENSFGERAMRFETPVNPLYGLFSSRQKKTRQSIGSQRTNHFSWCRHQMETFSALLVICAGNSPVTAEFPAHKGQWLGALMLSLICAWINGCVNNREAGDSRHHRAYYDVTVMSAAIAYEKKPQLI